jgi:predicted nucleic acid-binding Zn ribbon protein
VKRLGDILQDVVGRYRWQPAEGLLEIQAVWAEAVSPDLARVAVPVGFLDGTVTVAVPTSVWVQELTYLREPLMAELNRRLEGVRVTRLRLVVRAAAPAPPIDGQRLHRLLEEARKPPTP